MPVSRPIHAAEISESFVQGKSNYFVDVQLWPLTTRLNPTGWIDNFLPNERKHAIHLLHSFTYFSEPLVNQLFVAAFQGLSRHVVNRRESRLRANAAWRTFLDTVFVTHVTGERPSIVDSGHLFVRKARDLLQISEDRILGNAELLEGVLSGRVKNVVFVDDFVGSGNQFNDTWFREHDLPGRSSSVTFHRSARGRATRFYYCPLLCTEKGKASIQLNCPAVTLSPAHFLTTRYSACEPESFVWPECLSGASATEFLKLSSARAGIPDADGAVGDWRGFQKLGLTIAFSHSVPDATLPIFTWCQNGWQPLLRSA